MKSLEKLIIYLGFIFGTITFIGFFTGKEAIIHFVKMYWFQSLVLFSLVALFILGLILITAIKKQPPTQN